MSGLPSVGGREWDTESSLVVQIAAPGVTPPYDEPGASGVVYGRCPGQLWQLRGYEKVYRYQDAKWVRPLDWRYPLDWMQFDIIGDNT